MRSGPFLILLTISALTSSAFASLPSKIFAPPSADDTLRVSLGTHALVQIRGQDLRVNGASIGSGTIEAPVTCNSADTLKPIYIAGLGKISSPAIIESPAGFIWFNNHSYRQLLTLYAEGDKCLAVNTLQMDHYLAGLLNKEMSPSWPIESLKAQAVASRTYALFQKANAHNAFYDLKNTTLDQVYEGADSETAQSNAAVQATRGISLTFKNEPIKAFYHANCGGKTEVPNEVWGTKFPYFKTVYCPFHQNQESTSRWQLSLTMQKLSQQLRTLLPKRFLQIAGIKSGPLNANQRLQNIYLVDQHGGQAVVNANSFRNALGNTRVKSTSFSLQSAQDQIQIIGQGYGHGVGLCQIGAREMAKQGKKFQDILRFYYPLAKLTHIQ
jgi:stage II sporulation protein D